MIVGYVSSKIVQFPKLIIGTMFEGKLNPVISYQSVIGPSVKLNAANPADWLKIKPDVFDWVQIGDMGPRLKVPVVLGL